MDLNRQHTAGSKRFSVLAFFLVNRSQTKQYHAAGLCTLATLVQIKFYFYLAEPTRGLTLRLPKAQSVHQQEQENCENWLVVADWGIAVALHPQPPTLQWPLLLRGRPASTCPSPACRCVWQRRGWCGGSWSPLQCPADGQRRRSYCSDPELTWWCTTLDTGMTDKGAKWEVYQNPSVQL